MIGPLNEWRQKRLVRGHEQRVPRISALVDQMTSREHSPDWVSGACLLVRRSDAEAAGLFDERYQLYTEDVDFCAAIRARGKHVQFLASAEVVHLRGQSVASRPVARPLSASPRPGAIALGLKARISFSVIGHSRKCASPQ